MMTKDAIEEQKTAANVASYKEVLPAAESFVSDPAVDAALSSLNGQVYSPRFGRSYINEAMIGKDAEGNTAGYVISVRTAEGYDGDIVLTVGIEADGTVSGIAFTEISETPGMGMRAAEPEFKDQFSGRKVSSFVLNKGGASGENTIDTVSGASTTSGAVVNAVNAALDFYLNNMKGGN